MTIPNRLAAAAGAVTDLTLPGPQKPVTGTDSAPRPSQQDGAMNLTRWTVPAVTLLAVTGGLTAGAYASALTASRMITLQGVRTHEVYAMWGSGCVDATVNSYLATGVL